MTLRRLAFIAALLAPLPVFGQDALSPDPNMPRPIEAHDSVFIEELTWMEIRDAMRAGKDTILVASGGVEMNGPYLVTGKHQVVLRANMEALARKLGDALVAPIVQFVPEGDFDPPTSHMRYPGAISVSVETFEALLSDIAQSFQTHGFKHVIFLSDSNNNVAPMQSVADRLSKKWSGGKTSIHYIPEFYKSNSASELLASLGIEQKAEGHHDNVPNATQMMVTDPTTVRAYQRMAAGKMSINGVDITPPRGLEIGRKVVDYRATIAAKAIRKATERN